MLRIGLGRAFKVGKAVLAPLPAIDSAVQWAFVSVTLIFGGTVVGIQVSGFAGLSLVLAALALLALRATWRLQREIDDQPVMRLSLDPARAYVPGHIEVPHLRPESRYCCVFVTLEGGRGDYCEGRIVACECRERSDFVPFKRFAGALELDWKRYPLERSIDIEADVPELLVVAIGVKDGNRVFLGTSVGNIGNAIELPHGEYRFKVRVRPTYSSSGTGRAERWFRLRHSAAWDQVELTED